MLDSQNPFASSEVEMPIGLDCVSPQPGLPLFD
jgi:hypothetical protein